jgi:hypothetical protein
MTLVRVMGTDGTSTRRIEPGASPSSATAVESRFTTKVSQKSENQTSASTRRPRIA